MKFGRKLWLLSAVPLLVGAYWTGIGFLNVQQSWTAGQGTTCANQWLNAISTAGVPSSTQPAFSNLTGSISATQVLSGGINGQFLQTNGSGTGSWAPATAQVCGSSGVTLNTAASTQYVGIGSLSGTQALTYFPSARTGTATGLYISAGASPGAARTHTYTLMGGAAGTTATALTCTISAAATACNDTAHTATITAGDLLSLRLVTVTSSSTTTHGWCLKYTVP
jgi:hypothetical protein